MHTEEFLVASMNTSLWTPITLSVGIATAAWAADADDAWVSKIRKAHPRLFLNSETWPAVKARALGPAKSYLDALRKRVDRYPAEPTGDSGGPAYQRDEAVGGKTVQVAFGTTGRASGNIRIAAGQDSLVIRELTGEVTPQSGLGVPSE